MQSENTYILYCQNLRQDWRVVRQTIQLYKYLGLQKDSSRMVGIPSAVRGRLSYQKIRLNSARCSSYSVIQKNEELNSRALLTLALFVAFGTACATMQPRRLVWVLVVVGLSGPVSTIQTVWGNVFGHTSNKKLIVTKGTATSNKGHYIHYIPLVVAFLLLGARSHSRVGSAHSHFSLHS